MHYMEFSKGYTLAPYSKIIDWEIEVAISKHLTSIKPRQLNLLGYGPEHAFGINFTKNLSASDRETLFKSMLPGDESFNLQPLLSNHIDEMPKYFLNHLNNIHEKKKLLSKDMMPNLLYVLAMADIIDPINRILNRHKVTLIFYRNYHLMSIFKC